jgi:hypothetical protein
LTAPLTENREIGLPPEVVVCWNIVLIDHAAFGGALGIHNNKKSRMVDHLRNLQAILEREIGILLGDPQVGQ